MLGMMSNKGGGSTNVSPLTTQQLAGSMPSKGGRTQNVPIPGNPANPGGSPLAALFMDNRPEGPQTGGPMPAVNTITQPKTPIIPPPVHTPLPQPAAPARPAWTGPIRTRADLGNYLQRFPD